MTSFDLFEISARGLGAGIGVTFWTWYRTRQMIKRARRIAEGRANWAEMVGRGVGWCLSRLAH